jgi:hypothetical protein
MTAEEVGRFAESVMGDVMLWRSAGANALTPAIFYTMEYNSCATQLRSLAMRHRALGIQTTETVVKLAGRFEEVHARYQNILSVAEERARALELAHAEMDRLRNCATQQQELMERMHSETASVRAAAAERLQAMLEKEAAIARLDADLKESHAVNTTLWERIAALELSLQEAASRQN